MPSRRRIVFVLMLLTILFVPSPSLRAQEASADNQPIDSDEQMFGKAVEDIQSPNRLLRNKTHVLKRAERQLKDILELYPNTPLRDQVEQNLTQVQEILAEHDFKIGHFYANKAHATGGTKGAKSRLQEIARAYPNFSRMDEVLLLLGKVYLIDEQPKDAANYFWKLVCQYPGSKHINEAFEQLGQIGFDSSKGCDSLKSK